MKEPMNVWWRFNYDCNGCVCFDLKKQGYDVYKPQVSESIYTAIKNLIKLAKKNNKKSYMVFNNTVLKIDNPNYSWDKLYSSLLREWNNYLDKIEKIWKDTSWNLLKLNAGVLSEQEFINYFIKKYPELKYLVWKDVNATPDSLFSSWTDDKELKRTIAWIVSFYKNYRFDWHKELTKLTREIITWPWDYRAMETFLVINDLTKSQKVVNIIKEKLQKIDKTILEKKWITEKDIDTVDHDKLLYIWLKLFPEISPSFQKLSKEYQEIILEWLSSNFNLGQLIQGEAPASNLLWVKNLSKKALGFYILHTIYDIAWASWHANIVKSLVLTNLTEKKMVLSFKIIRENQDNINEDNIQKIYKNYFLELADTLEKDCLLLDNLSEKEKYIIVRLASLFRFEKKEDFENLIKAYKNLHTNAKSIIEYHFEKDWVNDKWFLLYYLPAFVSNFYKYEKDLQKILTYIANFYHKSFIEFKNAKAGTYTIFMEEVVNLVNKTQGQIDNYNFHIKILNELEWKIIPKKIEKLPELKEFDLEQLRWKNFLFMWIGWGGDAIQATLLEKVAQEKWVNSLWVVSIRTKTVWSSTKDIKEWEERIPKNAEKITDWVYKISPISEMKWRFFEKNISKFTNTYLILVDKENMLNELAEKIAYLGDYIESNNWVEIDGVFWVDTWWDGLYVFSNEKETDNSKATPDQDVNVINLLKTLPTDYKYLVEFAPTIDSPKNTWKILLENDFREINSKKFKDYLPLVNLLKWKYYSKTTDTFKKALKWKKWLKVINIPIENVLNDKNPWDCFVSITGDTNKILIWDLRESLIINDKEYKIIEKIQVWWPMYKLFLENKEIFWKIFYRLEDVNNKKQWYVPKDDINNIDKYCIFDKVENIEIKRSWNIYYYAKLNWKWWYIRLWELENEAEYHCIYPSKLTIDNLKNNYR